MTATDAQPSEVRPIFPTLPGGRGGMPPEQVAEHQRGRLQGAMVEAVARHGYAGTTLRELVALAGVSKSTFYEHFENKQDCFLATFDEIVAELTARVTAAYRSGGDFRQQLLAGLGAFARLTVEEPAATTLVAVESLTLGAAGVAHSERALRGFEELIQESFDSSPAQRSVAPTTVRAIVAGIRGVTYRNLRRGHPEKLPGLVEELTDWTLCHQEPDGEAALRAAAAAERAVEPAPTDRDDAPGWQEPPDSKLSRRTLTQRERIVRAAARVVVEKSYAALSIPAISGAAGVSNQTFYEHFDGKRDALLAAFEILSDRAFRDTAIAFEREGDWAEAVGAGIRALLAHVAANPLFARLAFFELPTAGPVALDQADTILDRFTLPFGPELAPAETGGPLSQTIAEAIASGIWAVLQHEIARGRDRSLPQLAPAIAKFALAPFQRERGGRGATR